MKKVINNNRSRLVFPKYDLVIEPDEIKEVTEEQFEGILGNASIEEVLHESLKIEEKEKKEQKTTEDKSFNHNKGRKKKNY
ncbi:MAG: hypothetical protein KJI69_05965 [Patescibacteria group bacterium]|nr:hypothetical protein [Patescibacteria group bacterium]